MDNIQKAAGWLHTTGDGDIDAAHRKAVQAVGDQYDYAIEWFYDQAGATKTKLPAAMQYAAMHGGPFICCCLKSIAKRQLDALQTLQKCASQLGASFIIADQLHINKGSLEFFIANQRFQNKKIASASREAQAKIKQQIDDLGYYINRSGDRVERLGNPKISTTAVVKSIKSRQRKSDLEYQAIKPALKICVDRGLSLREIGYELGFSHTCAAKYKKRLLNGE